MTAWRRRAAGITPPFFTGGPSWATPFPSAVTPRASRWPCWSRWRCLTPGVWSATAAAAAPEEGAGAATKEPAVTLHPGDPAPKLYVSKWVKGEPVKEFEKGKVYVIECWASWCGPCRASIPHVTELQAKYKDKGLTVIGMNVWEHDLAAAEPFVKEMGDKMGYTVALDETDAKHPDPTGAGKTAKAWLAAAGQNGIPCSFIVDKDTKVAWIGHPMAMDRPLEQVVAGTFDAKKEAELQAKSEGLQKKISDAVRAKDYDKAMGVAGRAGGGGRVDGEAGRADEAVAADAEAGLRRCQQAGGAAGGRAVEGRPADAGAAGDAAAELPRPRQGGRRPGDEAGGKGLRRQPGRPDHPEGDGPGLRRQEELRQGRRAAGKGGRPAQGPDQATASPSSWTSTRPRPRAGGSKGK